MEVDDLRCLMNNINSAINVKTPAIPANNPTITPAMRRVGVDELEVGTGTLEVGIQKLRVDMCTPEIYSSSHSFNKSSPQSCFTLPLIVYMQNRY